MQIFNIHKQSGLTKKKWTTTIIIVIIITIIIIIIIIIIIVIIVVIITIAIVFVLVLVLVLVIVIIIVKIAFDSGTFETSNWNFTWTALNVNVLFKLNVFTCLSVAVHIILFGFQMRR